MKLEVFINEVSIEKIPEEERRGLIKKMLKKAAASINMGYTEDVQNIIYEKES